MKLFLSIVCLLLQHAFSRVVELNDETYDATTEGKLAFIKFYAPWCGHCKAMASDWEKLAAEYDGNDDIIIAEVDCTADDSEDICDDENIEGFPTIKYGDPTFLEDYEGERTYQDLSAFAKEHLKPSCSLKSTHLCSRIELTKFQAYLKMSVEDIEEAIEAINETIDALNEAMDEAIERLEQAYEELIATSEKIKADAKNSDYGIMKAVLAIKSKSRANDESL